MIRFVQRYDDKHGQLMLIKSTDISNIISLPEGMLIRDYKNAAGVIAIVLGTSDRKVGGELIEDILERSKKNVSLERQAYLSILRKKLESKNKEQLIEMVILSTRTVLQMQDAIKSIKKSIQKTIKGSK